MVCLCALSGTEMKKKFEWTFFPTFWEKKESFCVFLLFNIYIEEIILSNWRIFFLVPNCPFHYVVAKLSWCQIVWCQIVRCQIVRVPNCPFFNSWCQIVRCQIVRVPNCPVLNCPTTHKKSHSNLQENGKIVFHLLFGWRLDWDRKSLDQSKQILGCMRPNGKYLRGKIRHLTLIESVEGLPVRRFLLPKTVASDMNFMNLVWIDSNFFGSLYCIPNEIQTNHMDGGVVQFCQENKLQLLSPFYLYLAWF